MDHLLKINKEHKSSKKQEIQDMFYEHELDEASFQHDMAYEDFEDSPKRTAFNKVLRNKSFTIDKRPTYQHGLAWGKVVN